MLPLFRVENYITLLVHDLFIKFSLETKTFSYKCSTCPRSDLHGIKKHTLLCHFVQFNYNFIHKINLLNYVTDVFLIDS